MLKLLKKRERGGFTLLELLMVVIIIAILASIALPQYIRATEKARATEALQLAGAIRASENRYKAQSVTNVYTTVIGDLDAEMPATGTTSWGGGSPPAGMALGPNSVQFTRLGGTYGGQTLGVAYSTGVICGNFAPMGTLAACP